MAKHTNYGVLVGLAILTVNVAIAEDAAAPSEVERVVEAEPDLVEMLIKEGIEGDEGDESEYFATIFCMGPKAVPSILRAMEAETSDARMAAARCLVAACAHEEADRVAAVKGLTSAMRRSDRSPEEREIYRQVLHSVVRSLNPVYRRTIQTALEEELLDG